MLKSDALVDGRGDGVVPVVSARLAVVKNEQAFSCDHFDFVRLTPDAPFRAPLLTWLRAALKIE
ncbi:MAG: hypothetical protein QM811_08015 [Pirellulales bacterium]